MSPKKSIRFIALLEAAKGVLVLLAGFGLLGLIHRDAQRMAEELVRHFYLNPASRLPRIFVEAANSNDSTLWLLACAAFSYAASRLFEAFGLWRQRRWAAWLGAVSGALYIPIELYELLRGVSWPKLTLLSVNAVCVIYLARALRSTPPCPDRASDQAGTDLLGSPLLDKENLTDVSKKRPYLNNASARSLKRGSNHPFLGGTAKSRGRAMADASRADILR